MDLFNIGAMQFSDIRQDPSFAPLLNRNGGSGDFAALLERTRSTTAVNPEDSAGSVNTRRNASNIQVKDEKLFQLCLELETFLVKNLLSSMRNTVQKSNLIDQGFAGKIYEDMLYDEYAKDFTRNAGFGLAEQAYLQLTQR